MTESGLIARKESPEDRRINTIRLTKKGEKMWERLRERIDEHNELILSPLSASERQSLNGLFAKIISGFETRSTSGETVPIDID
jgi:DNA-binding MarR family transcriptional regulator